MKRGIQIQYEKQIQHLQDENRVLQERLRAKRYRAIDTIVDSTYGLARNVFHKKTERSLDSEVKDMASEADGTAETQVKVDTGRVDIINVNFFSWDGKTLFLGGAERYIFDLATLLKKSGYRPRILQGANFDFTKKYRGIEVVGVKMDDCSVNAISATFAPKVRDAELVISSPLEIACDLDIDRPIIAINHGICFDINTTTFESTGGNAYWTYQLALENVDSCICVDTNFINWVRTKEYVLGAKLHYIPNYYDPKLFKHTKTSSKKVRVLYPRRIYEARGSDITVRAFENILQKYSQKVDLTFVGQYNSDEDKAAVESLMQRYPKNVFHKELQPEEMPAAYAEADIVLIPTKYSEGTSLSCIEAMASRTTVVATTVGGLPNLIINDYNGLLVEPNAQSIEEAVTYLLENPDQRELLAKRGEEVAKASFQKPVWEGRWKHELAKFLKNI